MWGPVVYSMQKKIDFLMVPERLMYSQTSYVALYPTGLGAPVICTFGTMTEIEVRMNASLNASSLLDNTEIFFRAGGAEMVSAVCTSRPHTPENTSDSHTCVSPTEDKVMLPVALGVCLLLMVLLLGTCCLYKKKQKQAKTSERSADDRCEDPQELVYCQVQVVKKKERPKKQEQDPQVTYGEVKVSGKSKAARRTPNEQADTIYSGIRT
ncbi:uncharacterized protein LOC118223343 [Anguilla anguilla]|uniref:uncharacterized protein LOC118223343 n=1 Tax=Anguilla anguilla TaxID=7936 RepID=UPI0015AEA6A0|nr:uncharacterized protein LOC118223343 [Anguilla anguilla]